MSEEIKTYVLAGDDPDETFSEVLKYYRNAELEIIRAEPGQTLESAVKQIQGPANIILAAHGWPDGTFRWHDGEDLSYSELFRNLPQDGIASIGLLSCFGGTAQQELSSSPPGALIYTVVGDKSVGTFALNSSFAWETKNLDDPVAFYLEALDNFDPEGYRQSVECMNKRDGVSHNFDAENALPRIIGIGGQTPQMINLDDKVKQLAESSAELARNPAPWADAVARVKQHFDKKNWGPAKNPTPNCLIEWQSSAEEETRLLHARIDAVARKIEQGDVPIGTEERRIAYGLTVAYMDESGKLAQMQTLQAWKGVNTISDATLRELVKNDTLASIDGADGSQRDRKISLTELKEALNGRGITSLDTVDTDHDHTITATEITAALRHNGNQKTR